MAGFKYLLDHDVRHLSSYFADKQTLQLEDVGLTSRASDEEIIAVASERNCVIVTNNRRDFENKVTQWIAESSKKKKGCTQVHGLIIILPSEQISQERALTTALKNLRSDGNSIGMKDVHERCLKVVVEASGKAVVTRLPRCPHCEFSDEDES